jgi:signal transduction histidine kinase
MTSLDRASVLVVDDTPDNLLALEALLAPLDIEIVRAHSGADALRYLLHEDVALILLDVQMPELDGFETARLIKARARTANIPIIFLTALSREREHLLEGYESGAVDYLAKPFEPEVLISKVSVFIALWRQAKTIEQQADLLGQRLDERDRAQRALRVQAAELERSNAELERFAFLASHDLREPLQVAAGFLELARKGPAAEELLDRASASISSMIGLIDELLTYAQATVGDQHLEPVDLAGLFADVREELGDPVTAGAKLTVDPLPTVFGDRWQLGRVFFHLLDNAMKFRGEADPEVHVGLARREDHWVISVRDNGIGLDANDAPTLFTMFSRLHSRDEHAGAGVGLALSRRVVERHGGVIWIDSLPGRGATISFTLPVWSP